MIIPTSKLIKSLTITIITLTNLILAQDFTSNATGIQGTWSSGSGSVLTGPVSYTSIYSGWNGMRGRGREGKGVKRLFVLLVWTWVWVWIGYTIGHHLSF